MTKRKLRDESYELAKLGDLYYNDSKKKYKKAFNYYQLSNCTYNNLYAQHSLGFCYANGYGVQKNLKKAVEYFILSKESDEYCAEAYMMLGNCYYDGDEHLDQDYETAFEYYSLGIDVDNKCVDTQRQLGLCYYYGNGVPQDFKEALEWFELSGKKGDPIALGYLGRCYYSGYAVDVDLDKGIAYFKLSLRKGNKSVNYDLGMHYQDKKNYKKAIKHLVLAEDTESELELLRIFNDFKDFFPEKYYAHAYFLCVKHNSNNELKQKIICTCFTRIINIKDVRNIIALYLL